MSSPSNKLLIVDPILKYNHLNYQLQDEKIMKWILALMLSFLSFSSFAAPEVYSNCKQALPTDNPGFCASFKSAAACYCKESGGPGFVCQNMDLVYKLMMERYHHKLQEVCEAQHDTSTQTCIDDWNCYRNGGKDSQGRLCSSTGKVCS